MTAKSNWKDGLRGRLLLAVSSFLFSGLLFLAAGEIFLRATRAPWTPDSLRVRVLEYERTLFSRTAFPQAFQTKFSVHTLETRESEKGASLGLVSTAIINERGYRGENFVVPKPADLTRIMVLGGSSAFDIDAIQGHDWPSLVETELVRNGFDHVEVINAGTPAHASWDALGRLYSEIWMFQPDYVILYNAYNDIHYFKELSPEKSLLRSYRPPPRLPAGAGKNSPLTKDPDHALIARPQVYYTGIIDRLLSFSQVYVRLRGRYWDSKYYKAREVSDEYSEWGPRQYALNLAMVADAARNIGAKPIFLVQPRWVAASNTEEEIKRFKNVILTYGLSHDAIVRAFADCDQAMLRVAQEKEVDVLNLSEKFTGQKKYFIDHIHTSQLGSQVIAKTVGNFLVGILENDINEAQLQVADNKESSLQTPQEP